MFLKILGKLKGAWGALPPWAQGAVNDLVAVAFIAVVSLNLVIPGSLDQAKSEALIAASAVIGVLEPWVRRHIPDAWGWLKAQWAKAPAS